MHLNTAEYNSQDFPRYLPESNYAKGVCDLLRATVNLFLCDDTTSQCIPSIHVCYFKINTIFGIENFQANPSNRMSLFLVILENIYLFEIQPSSVKLYLKNVKCHKQSICA